MRHLALVGVAATLLLVRAGDAAAACVAVPGAQLREQAEVIFTGVALPGPAGGGGALLSPATFAVLEREKGRVDASVLVETAVSAGGDGAVAANAEGISPAPGEVWRILGGAPGDDGVVPTGVCAGSRLLRQATQAELAAATAAAREEDDAGATDTPAIALITGAVLLAAILGGATVAARRRLR